MPSPESSAAYTEELAEGLTAHGEKSSGVAQSRERSGNASPGQGDAEYGEVAGLSPAPGRTFSPDASTRTGRHEQRWWKRWYFIFEPRDLWIGVFVSPEKLDKDSGDFVQRTYFAPIPTIVLVRQVWRPGV